MSAWGRGTYGGSGGFKSCDLLLRRLEQNDPTLQTMVILPMKTFGDTELKCLSNILRSGRNTHLKELYASGHDVSAEALREFGNAIVVQTAKNGSNNKIGIQKLAIGSQQTGDDGIVAFCEPFITNSTSCQEYSATLIELDLSQKGINVKGFETIGRAFGTSKTLKHLNLSNNNNQAVNNSTNKERCVQAFSKAAVAERNNEKCFPNLQVLNLSNTQMDPSDLLCLIEALTDTNRADPATLDANKPERPRPPLELNLSQNPNLGNKDDNIKGTTESLAEKKNNYLDCERLYTLLQRLLSPKLSNNRVVTSLNVSDCNVTDDSIIVNALCNDGLNGYGQRSLDTLNLSNNQLSCRSAQMLAKALCPLSTNDPTTSDRQHPPCHLGTLNELNLANNPLLGGKGILTIASALENGEHTSSNDNTKEDEHYPRETLNTTLQVLDVSNTGCTAESAAALLRCTHLTSLRLFNNSLGGGGGTDDKEQKAKHFVDSVVPLLRGGHATLKHLDLGGNRLSCHTINALFRSLLDVSAPFDTVLHTLEFGGNDIDAEGEELLKHLAIQHPKLDIVKDKPLVQQEE